MSDAVGDPGGRNGSGRHGQRRFAGAARIVFGALLVAAAIAALGALTRFDYGAEPARAELRLSWRTPVPRVVECREPTAEELAELPVHMRQDEICEGRAVAYRLEVSVDGAVVHRSRAEGEGARGDRPLQVFEELPLEPGPRRVRVVFERADGAGAEAGTGSATAGSPARVGTGAREVPARLVLDQTLKVGVRDVVLVTYDRDGGRLVLQRGPGGQEG